MPIIKKAAEPAEFVPGNIISICEAKRSNLVRELAHRHEMAVTDIQRGAIGMSGQPRDPETTRQLLQMVEGMEAQIVDVSALQGVALADRFMPEWRGAVEAQPLSAALARGKFMCNMPPIGWQG